MYNTQQCKYSREENIGTGKKERSGNSKPPERLGYGVIKWNRQVCHQSAITLSSFPRSAVLFWVLVCCFSFLFPLSHLCVPKMSDRQTRKKNALFSPAWMENLLPETHLRAVSSVSSCSALQKISSESRNLINLPTMVLCPGTETLLLFTPRILSLSHGSKPNGKHLPASLLAKTMCVPSP